MLAASLILAMATAGQAPVTQWVAVMSRDGGFIVDLPGKPTASASRPMRTRGGEVKAFVVECDTPDVLYSVQKIELPPLSAKLKQADMEAILSSFRDDLASEFNSKVLTQKKLRLDGGGSGLDFVMEGRPDPKGPLSSMRVRGYLTQKALYFLIAATAADNDLPDEVGHFFASFTPGLTRTKKVGPLPEVEGRPLGTWGSAIDPDGDCKISEKGKALTIAIPNTHHDLNADNNKLNAPRVVREVTGDFSMTVRVTGAFKPSAKSTNPKAVPYIGGGILVWLDSDNYIFLGRAGINRGNKVSEFAAFEEREWGSRAAFNNKGIEPGGVYLRLERKGNRLFGSTSKDGKTWNKLDPMDTTYPATIKVGLYAINGCTDPVEVKFDNFTFAKGKAGGSAKAKRR